MLTVIQYYIIIKIKKTKASRRDLKKGKNMKIKNFEAFAKRVARKLDTKIIRVSSDVIWFANYYYINFDGEFIYIADYSKDTPRKVMCAFIYNYNTQKEFFQDLEMMAIKEVAESEEPEETEKHYADYTSEDFIKAGIAKECTDCPDFCEEDCIENAECASGYDVFDGCKTEKEVMEVKQKLNAQFGKEICKPSPLDVMGCIMCPADRKGNHCSGRYYCEQTWKRYSAIVNPEWHHVRLATLANIDNNMLDEKRQCYMHVYLLLKDFRQYAFKISRREIYFDLVRNVIKDIQQGYFNNKISIKAYNYACRHIESVSVEKSYFTSSSEQAFGYKESKRYKITLR